MAEGLDKLRTIFDEAIQAAPERRRAVLESRCNGDAEMMRRIEAMIATAEVDGRFLADPTAEAARSRPSSGPLDPVHEAPGSRIGPYKLLQRIGEGGFGAVFMAEQLQPLRRRVALKIIKLGMDTRQVIARFEAERQALALMDHPHIATVLDAGATESGRPYFVMEYVKGDPITAFADAHKLSVRERLELFAQVCAAVQHAHMKGVIHRDLKPRNVLVSMTDGRPLAKVIDFGIAKATGARLTDMTLFTEHHQLIGTPEYMSPEQAQGLPDIDTRTDVYSLGVLLYELLTGATPFDAKRLRSAALGELARIIREEEPPAPSLRLSRNLEALASTAAARRIEPARLGSLLKGELDWIVLKALEKDRGRRYESPGQLAADVQRHLAGEPVVAAPPGAMYRVGKFVRRNRGLVTTAAAVVLSLGAGLATAAVVFVRGERIAFELAQQRERAERAAREAAEEAHRLAELERTGAELRAYLTALGRAADVHNISESVRPYDRARAELDACPSGLRGWEWSYLRHINTPTNVIRAHDGPVEVVCISPDGRLIASGSSEDPVRIWLRDGGDMLCELATIGQPAAMSFSASGRHLVTATAKQIAIWDVQSGREAVGLRSVSGSTSGVAISDDLCWLAVYDKSKPNDVVLHDLRSGSEPPLLTSNGEISGERFRGVDLVSGQLRVWLRGRDSPLILRRDLASSGDSSVGERRRLEILEQVGDSRTFGLASTCTDRLCRWFVRGTKDGQVEIWDRDAPPGTGYADTRGWYNFHELAHVVWLRDGLHAIVSSGAGVQRFNTVTEEVAQTFHGLPSASALCVDSEERFLVTGTFSGQARVALLEDGRILEDWDIGDAEVTALSAAPEHPTIYAGTASGIVEARDLADARTLFRLELGSAVCSLAASPRSDHLGCALADGRILILDPASGEILRTLHQIGVTQIQFSPIGESLLVCSEDELTVVSLTQTGPDAEAISSAPFLGDTVAGQICATFTPDGQRIISGDTSGNLVVWDAATLAKLVELPTDGSGVTLLTLSHDGSALLAGEPRWLGLWRSRPAPQDQIEHRHRLNVARAVLATVNQGRAVDLEQLVDRTTILPDEYRGIVEELANSPAVHFERLKARYITMERIVRAIQSDPSIPESERTELLTRTQSWSPTPYQLSQLALAVALDESADAESIRAAIDAARQASEDSPSNYFYQLTLGAALTRAGEFRAAKPILEELLEDSHSAYNSAAIAFLAVACAKTGERERAQELANAIRVLRRSNVVQQEYAPEWLVHWAIESVEESHPDVPNPTRPGSGIR